MSDAARIVELEDVLYRWLLTAGGEEDLFDYAAYDAAYKVLGLPERMAELKARYQADGGSKHE